MQLWNTTGAGWARGATLAGPTQRVNVVAYRHDGAQLVVGSADETVRVYDPHHATLLRTLPQPQAVIGAAFLAGRLLTTSADGTLRVWPRNDPDLHGVRGDVHQLSVAGNLLAAGIAPAVDPGAGPADADGGGGNGAIELWPLDSARPATVRFGDPDDPFSGAVALNPTGTLLAAGTVSGAVRLFDTRGSVAALVELDAAPDPDHPNERVEQVAFSPSGGLLAATGDSSTVRLWRVSAGSVTRIAVLAGPQGYTYSPAFSHDESLLAAGSADGRVYVWRLHDDGAPTRVGPALGGFTGAVRAVRFAPRTDVLAAADTRVELFDFSGGAQGTPVSLGVEMNSSRSAVYALDFSADGGLLAAAHRAMPPCTCTARGPVSSSPRCARPRYRCPASPSPPAGCSGGAVDGTVYRWTTDLPRAQASLCARAGTPVSDTVWDQYVPGEAYDQPCPD